MFDKFAFKEIEKIFEKLDYKMGADAYIKDFEKSDAPQFKGKTKEERRKMAIAAYMTDKSMNEKESDMSNKYIREELAKVFSVEGKKDLNEAYVLSKDDEAVKHYLLQYYKIPIDLIKFNADGFRSFDYARRIQGAYPYTVIEYTFSYSSRSGELKTEFRLEGSDTFGVELKPEIRIFKT